MWVQWHVDTVDDLIEYASDVDLFLFINAVAYHFEVLGRLVEPKVGGWPIPGATIWSMYWKKVIVRFMA